MSWECGCGVVNKDSTTACRGCLTPKGETWESMRAHPEATPRAKAWIQLSDQIGGEFIFLGWDKLAHLMPLCKVRARVKNWTITIDEFRPKVSTGYGGTAPGPPVVQMKAPYVRKDQFWFDIFRSGLSSRVKRFFGTLESIKIGDPNFDDHFIVRSNDPSKARALLANINVRHLIRTWSWISDEHIRVAESTELPEGIVTLYFEPCEARLVDDLLIEPEAVMSIKSLFELFTEILNQLVEIGSASKEAPNVEL